MSVTVSASGCTSTPTSVYEDEVLVPNMIMCIEVSQKFEGLGNFHVEDMVLLGEKENEVLTSLSDTSEMLVVG